MLIGKLYWTVTSVFAISPFSPWQSGFIERYVKTVIGSRTVPSKHLLLGCKSLLRHVGHKEFQDVILPAIDKAMLRSPEIILEGFIYLLAGLNIDLSQYAQEISKHLASMSNFTLFFFF